VQVNSKHIGSYSHQYRGRVRMATDDVRFGNTKYFKKRRKCLFNLHEDIDDFRAEDSRGSFDPLSMSSPRHAFYALSVCIPFSPREQIVAIAQVIVTSPSARPFMPWSSAVMPICLSIPYD